MDESQCWNEFYSGKSASELVIPSQFAAFVASEYLTHHDCLVDLGCGTGRDSAFFQGIGIDTLGVDASPTAIERCSKLYGPTNAKFLCAPISETGLSEKIKSLLAPHARPLLYARFFLHAIDEEAQTKFLELTRKIVGDNGRLAVEFRTERDQQQLKVTPSHYRRYIDPLSFAVEANLHNFRVVYFVEGFGYAKYREDDAHVARFILEPNCDPTRHRA